MNIQPQTQRLVNRPPPPPPSSSASALTLTSTKRLKVDDSSLDHKRTSMMMMESLNMKPQSLRPTQHNSSSSTKTSQLNTAKRKGDSAFDISWLSTIPKALIDPIADSYIRLWYGGTLPAPRCLLDAIYCGDEGTAVMLLLRRDHILGATNVDICNFRELWSQRTPLSCAIEAGRHDLALLLLEYGANGALTDSLYGETALHGATRHCRNTRLCLAAHDNGDHSIHNPRKKGREAINRNKVRRELVATIKARDRLAARLLEKDGSRLVNMVNNRGDTVLHIAASGGDAIIARMLLQYGPNVNARDARGCTPLMLAAESGDIETVELLLRCGADHRCTDASGLTALYHAYGCNRSMRRLMERGADVNFVNGEQGTILKKAIIHGNEDIVGLLLRHGADISSKDRQGRTALHHAVAHGRRFVLEMLLKKDSSGIDLQDSNNDTALHLAIRSEVLVRILLAYGANVELRNGHTVRELALKVLGPHDGVCQLLSDEGHSNRPMSNKVT